MPGDRDAWDRDADLRSVQATYRKYEAEGRADLWDEGRPGYARLVRELNAALLDVLGRALPHPRARVLDLGCGTGDLLGITSPTWPQLDWVGVDLRPDAIDEARRRFPGSEFITASADDVPLPDASVDVVVCRLLFSSLPSRRLERSVSAEIGRLLRSDGSLVWLDLRYSNPTNASVHGIRPGRLVELFPQWSAAVRSVGLLPPISRRLGPATPFLYPLLRAMPPLRSHLVGRLRRSGHRP